MKPFTYHFLEVIRVHSVFYSDLRRAINNRYVKMGAIVSVVYPLVYFLSYLLILKIAKLDVQIYGDDILSSSYIRISSFIVTAVITGFLAPEFSDGIIRNKLITGASRNEAFTSLILVSGIVAGMMSAIASVTSLIISVLFTPGFGSLTTIEMGDYILSATSAQISIAVFSTMLLIVLGNSKISLAIPLAVAFIMKVIATVVQDKLYPTEGVCTLTGTRLKVYTLFDQYVPYSCLTRTVQYTFSSCFVGAMVLIIFSVVFGLIIFDEKDIV